MKNYYIIILIAIVSCLFTSCSEDDAVETSISYTITMSPDLLKFVTPQVSYIDEDGNLVTITGVEDLDGKVIENSAEVSNGDTYASSWSSVVITGTGYKCWTIRMKFRHVGFHSYMSVKYIRNDFVEDTTGKVYDFQHDINTSINIVKISDSDINMYQDSHVSVPVGSYHYGDNIESYLNDLYNNPDQVGYYIDENGNATRKDEF